jgi:lysophospholipase L1-like esterase
MSFVSKRLAAALLASLGCLVSLRAEPPEMQFRNGFEEPFELSGFPWRGANGELRRLPPHITDKTVKPIMANFHSYHTSGGEVRFCTDSDVITVRAEVYKISDPPHMTRNAACGFALYLDAGGKNERLMRAMSPSTSEMRGNSAKPTRRVDGTVKLPGRKMRSFSLFLPLYAGVRKLEIGVVDGARFAPPPPRKVKLPVCFYGSSITQGCSAGHSGNNYTTMLCRAVGAPQINLGFSGAARGEVEMAEAIATLKMSALVIDYDHNAPNAEHLRNTHERFFRIIRKAQPELPIILVSGPRDKGVPRNCERRDIVKATYDRAAAAGDKHVYFVDGLEFFDRVPRKYCTVDNTHPSDLGFYLMFQKILPVLRRALGE